VRNIRERIPSSGNCIEVESARVKCFLIVLLKRASLLGLLDV